MPVLLYQFVIQADKWERETDRVLPSSLIVSSRFLRTSGSSPTGTPDTPLFISFYFLGGLTILAQLLNSFAISD